MEAVIVILIVLAAAIAGGIHMYRNGAGGCSCCPKRGECRPPQDDPPGDDSADE